MNSELMCWFSSKQLLIRAVRGGRKMAGVYYVELLSGVRKARVILVYYPSGKGSWFSFSFKPSWLRENYIKRNYLRTNWPNGSLPLWERKCL